MPALRKIRNRYYAYFYDPARRPKRKSVPLGTGLKTAAERKLRRLEIAFAEERFNPWRDNSTGRRDTSIDAAIDGFLSDRSHLRPKSIAAYTSVLAGLRSVSGKKQSIRDITPEEISHYVSDPNVAQSTRRHRAQYLKAFFRWAISVGLLKDTPMDHGRRPERKQKVPEFLTPAEIDGLLAAIDEDAGHKRTEGLATDDEILWLKDLVLVAVKPGCGEVSS